jgi:hypothetical protein
VISNPVYTFGSKNMNACRDDVGGDNKPSPDSIINKTCNIINSNKTFKPVYLSLFRSTSGLQPRRTDSTVLQLYVFKCS